MLKSCFPYFGGKSSAAGEIWSRFGRVKQYIEPFCGSAAVLLAAPGPASLEVIGDQNCYIANFWRALKCHPESVIGWQDYPVSHIDLYARHLWLTEPDRVAALKAALVDAEWPGDPKIAGWWLWGQCCWIGSGWCEGARELRRDGSPSGELGQIPHASDAGRGVQAVSLGKIPHAGDAGRGAAEWLLALSRRLERVRIVHGDWSRCLNSHYGGSETAILFDPPYKAFERLYAKDAAQPVADDVATWAREHADLRIALCGHQGDYDLPGWDVHEWSRGKHTYAGSGTTNKECIWFSPACLKARQAGLFAEVSNG